MDVTKRSFKLSGIPSIIRSTARDQGLDIPEAEIARMADGCWIFRGKADVIEYLDREMGKFEASHGH